MPAKSTDTSSAARVAAHRRNWANSGYVRAEVALPRPVHERIRTLAHEEGTSSLELLSSLAQLGLSVYAARADRPANVACASVAAASCAAPPADATASTATLSTPVAQAALSPIAKFFRTRKES